MGFQGVVNTQTRAINKDPYSVQVRGGGKTCIDAARSAKHIAGFWQLSMPATKHLQLEAASGILTIELNMRKK